MFSGTLGGGQKDSPVGSALALHTSNSGVFSNIQYGVWSTRLRVAPKDSDVCNPRTKQRRNKNKGSRTRVFECTATSVDAFSVCVSFWFGAMPGKA